MPRSARAARSWAPVSTAFHPYQAQTHASNTFFTDMSSIKADVHSYNVDASRAQDRGERRSFSDTI
jgi:hypothetical protein